MLGGHLVLILLKMLAIKNTWISHLNILDMQQILERNICQILLMESFHKVLNQFLIGKPNCHLKLQMERFHSHSRNKNLINLYSVYKKQLY